MQYFKRQKQYGEKKSSNTAISISSQPMTVVKTVFFPIMILAVVPTTLIRQLQIGGASCTEITLTAGWIEPTVSFCEWGNPAKKLVFISSKHWSFHLQNEWFNWYFMRTKKCYVTISSHWTLIVIIEMDFRISEKSVPYTIKTWKCILYFVLPSSIAFLMLSSLFSFVKYIFILNRVNTKIDKSKKKKELKSKKNQEIWK